MKKLLVRNKQIFKQGIFAFAIIIVISSLLIFVDLIDQVKSEAKSDLEFRVSVFEQMMKSTETDASFLLHNIIDKISYPVIVTDRDSVPQSWINIPFTKSDSISELNNFLEEFESYAKPIPMQYDSLTLGYYFYGEPSFIRELKWLPVGVLILISLLIMLAYYGVKNIRISEKQYIWFGMAKEAAHQLGTPTSSLSGWIELMKNDEFKQEYVEEVENDLSRIQTVINRFSMIGSQPRLTEDSINDIIHEVVTYFRTRQPQFNNKLSLQFIPSDEDVSLKLNRELILWVFENLIKNAMDAISDKKGLIEIRTLMSEKSVVIWCTDNGCGMDAAQRKKVFEPGFSTKRRGWGIGLSLTKRIIDEFHNGRIEVESTKINEGTRFRIDLKR